MHLEASSPHLSQWACPKVPQKISQSSHCPRYNRNKLVFTAVGKPHWVEELNDDFDDMDEDIESYRCTCN